MTTDEFASLRRQRFLHTNMRLRGRFEAEIDEKAYDRLCELLKSGRVPVAGKTNRNHPVYEVNVRGKTVQLVFRRSEGLIATALPPDSKVQP